MVYLVGAGPGDSKLISIKGLECIKNADAVIYDRLVNPSLLSCVKDGCTLIYAGKAASNHSLTQEEINSLLISCAGKYENVVRLKGGDPFIFGRGGEEAETLSDSGIPYEIIPGISSCYAAAEYCGIPVTHRKASPSFHVITGHRREGAPGIDYGLISRLSGTLVFMMGLSNINEICEKLIENGKPPETEAAVISRGTAPKQQLVLGTLNDISYKAKNLTSPAVIVIGEAIRRAREWFAPCGKTVLATGTAAMNSALRRAAGNMDITDIPLIKTEPLNYGLFCETDLGRFSHIAFTSARGVDIFFDYMKRSKTDIRIFGDTKFACVGEKTSAALEKRGIFADIVPDRHCSAALAERLAAEKGNILLVRAENGSDDMTDIISRSDTLFTDLKLYRTQTDYSKGELLNLCVSDADYIIFSSGSAAAAMRELLKTDTNAKFISIGNETAKAAEKYGFEIYKTAEKLTAEGIIECIKNDMEGH